DGRGEGPDGGRAGQPGAGPCRPRPEPRPPAPAPSTSDRPVRGPVRRRRPAWVRGIPGRGATPSPTRPPTIPTQLLRCGADRASPRVATRGGARVSTNPVPPGSRRSRHASIVDVAALAGGSAAPVSG